MTLVTQGLKLRAVKFSANCCTCFYVRLFWNFVKICFSVAFACLFCKVVAVYGRTCCLSHFQSNDISVALNNVKSS